jgi:molybdopterin converting factor small subunit
MEVNLQSYWKNGAAPTTSLNEIIQQGETLKISREHQTIDWLESQLEQQIRVQLAKTTQRNVQDVNVQVVQPKNNEVAIKTISVVLGKKTTGPIAPIAIELHPTGGTNDDSKSLQECMRWQQWLKQTWGQSETSVSVKISE